MLVGVAEITTGGFVLVGVSTEFDLEEEYPGQWEFKWVALMLFGQERRRKIRKMVAEDSPQRVSAHQILRVVWPHPPVYTLLAGQHILSRNIIHSRPGTYPSSQALGHSID